MRSRLASIVSKFVVTLIRLPWWLLQTVVCLTLSPLSSDERWRHVHARYFSALGTSTEKAFAKAKAFVKKYGAKAVIIDSMGLAMAGDMDRAKDVIAFHRQFTDPLRALGTTPFVVDHEGKLQAGENRKEKGPTGSAFKSWTTRSVLQFILEEYDEANSALDIRVRQHKTNFKPTKPFGVRFTFGEKKVSIETIDLLDTELIDEAYVPVKDRIVAALKPGDATIRSFTGTYASSTSSVSWRS